MLIKCKKHGIFNSVPLNHIYGKSGCPNCNLSKGEIKIENILSDLESEIIKFIHNSRS